MNIPNFYSLITGVVITEDRKFTPEIQSFFNQMLNEMNQNLSNEGVVMPPVSSANSSVSPPAAGGQIAQVAVNALNGTTVYDPNIDKLTVRLSDGNFHTITST